MRPEQVPEAPAAARRQTSTAELPLNYLNYRVEEKTGYNRKLREKLILHLFDQKSKIHKRKPADISAH